MIGCHTHDEFDLYLLQSKLDQLVVSVPQVFSGDQPDRGVQRQMGAGQNA